MPYIPEPQRKKFLRVLTEFRTLLVMEDISVGDLNFQFTKMLKSYISIFGESYENYNALMGMMMCCMLEFYRKDVSNYEDLKEKLNGEVV